MTEPDPVSRLQSLTSEATPAAPAADAAPVAPASSARLALDGDELVQFSVKPSLWFIGFVSARWLAVLTLLGAALAIAARGVWSGEAALVLQVLITTAAGRLAVGMLQWASRVYVLTNRRVMCFRGVLTVEVTECPLGRIGAVDRFASGVQRRLRLGTLRIAPADPQSRPILWEHVAHPDELYERLVRAIRRGQNGDA